MCFRPAAVDATAPTSKKCAACGAENDVAAETCESCGASEFVEAPPAPAASRSPFRTCRSRHGRGAFGFGRPFGSGSSRRSLCPCCSRRAECA